MSLIRLDRGLVALSGRKPHLTEDGILLLDSVFAKDGVLEYRVPGQTEPRRELRHPDENKKALGGFGLVSVTDEHPPGLLNSDNASLYRRGITLGSPRYEVVTGKGGFVVGQVAIFDSELQQRILDGEQVETSTGYRCENENTPGVFKHLDGKDYRYDAIQRGIKVNHQAITRKARAGSDVSVYLDSIGCDRSIFGTQEVGVLVTPIEYELFDSSQTPQLFDLKGSRRMAQLRIDSAVYDNIPEAVAAVISEKLARMDALEKQVGEIRDLERTNEELRRTRDSIEAERDAWEFQLNNAEEILEQFGYTPDSRGGYLRSDASKKPPKMEEPEEEEEEEEYEEGEEEEEEEEDDESSNKEKEDSMDQRTDAYIYQLEQENLRHELTRIDSVLYDPESPEMPSFSEYYGDAIEPSADARRIFVQLANPGINLDSYDDAAIELLYQVVMDSDDDEEDYEDEEEEYGDEEESYDSGYVEELAYEIEQARRESYGNEPGTQPYGIKPGYAAPLALSIGGN